MTKAELVNYIAKDCKISKSMAENVLNTVTHNIGKCLRKKDKITLTGFGTFYVSKRRARTGRNPQTGAEIQIKARSVPRFKPGKQLKDWVL
ncbi:MAG: HU family DNA-binding protein [Pseudomonadota bacterium]